MSVGRGSDIPAAPNPQMLPAQNYELESCRFQNHNFGGLQQTPTLDHPMGLLRGERKEDRESKGEQGAWIPRNLKRSFYFPRYGEGAALSNLNQFQTKKIINKIASSFHSISKYRSTKLTFDVDPY